MLYLTPAEEGSSRIVLSWPKKYVIGIYVYPVSFPDCFEHFFMMLEQIRKAETWIPKEEKTEQFIKEFFYSSDGKASERIADSILDFLKQHKSHLF